MNRKLSFLLAAPLVVVPLITLLAWSAGVGKGAAKQTPPATGGLNTQLPAPQPPNDSWWGKIDFYKQAEEDSARYTSRKAEDRKAIAAQGPDSSAARVYSSLARLQQALGHPAAAAVPARDALPAPAQLAPPPPVPGLSRWPPPALPRTAPPPAPDPDLQQLSAMLDKVMAIQHPGQLKAPVPATAPQETITLDTGAAIEAITETEGTLTSGSVIALRVSADVRWRGLFIPANTLVYGTATLENERLHIRIRSIRMGDMLCSVSLEAYDLDGMAGIYVPGSLGRDAAKASAEEAIGGLTLGAYDPGAGAQAAGAGIQAMKSLLSRKVKQVRVTVREGYAVLLK
jgi:hypothetical protein